MNWWMRGAICWLAVTTPIHAQDVTEVTETETRAAPGPFIVFFDWDGRAIARDDGELLSEVIQAYRQNPGYRLLLVGHSDRSGPAAHNRVLARGRAVVVRDHLVKQGVPSSAIEVSSAGEERPLIATADGVREAQNRRVEIEFVE